MHIGYTDQQEALRQELRSYYARLLTPEVEEQLAHSQGVGPVHRQIVRHMGEDGWLGVGWPKEYGGRGFTAVEQFVFFDESMRAGAPVPMLTINTVGPTIMEFGSQEQRDFFLPRILKGEIRQVAFAIHKVGAALQNAPSCNGWTFWHVEQSGAPLDALRQQHLSAL